MSDDWKELLKKAIGVAQWSPKPLERPRSLELREAWEEAKLAAAQEMSSDPNAELRAQVAELEERAPVTVRDEGDLDDTEPTPAPQAFVDKSPGDQARHLARRGWRGPGGDTETPLSLGELARDNLFTPVEHAKNTANDKLMDPTGVRAARDRVIARAARALSGRKKQEEGE
jgi:hypothetical protein